MSKFNQLCVWPATIVGNDQIKEFTNFFKKEMGVRVKFLEEVKTLPTPNVPDTGGRNDVFFFVHDDDIMKFAVPRLQIGIRWWEDVLGNGGGELYPEFVLAKYPKIW